MPVIVELDDASGGDESPDADSFRRWASACVADDGQTVLSIRLVDERESAALNGHYRQRNHATNVLSFPMHVALEDGGQLLGDLAICSVVVAREAREQHKPEDAHWAHMTVHGVLHLLGFDHETDDEALLMEQREREILAGLGYPDPYAAEGYLETDEPGKQ